MLKTLILIRLKGIFLRQTKSSIKKHSSVGRIILMTLLFGYLGIVFIGMFGTMFYSLVEPLHVMQIDWLYFAIMGLMVIIFCFIGSIFITYHEIYEAKDNELLLSMPITNRDILLSRVFTILILNYIYELLIALPAFVVYITKIGMNALQIIFYLGIVLTLPLFVLAISCFFGWILAHVLTRIKRKNIISIIFYILFMGVYFVGISYIESYMTWLVQNGNTIASAIEKSLFPIYHMSIAVQNSNIISFIIYLLCATLPFVLVIYLLSTNFIKLATTKPQIKKVVYKAKELKTNSIKKALFQRELKHFTSNAMVMMNAAVGIVFCIIGTGAVFMYSDTIQMVFKEMPELQTMIVPILCLMGVGVNSMNTISASSISLEGNRFWIMKSLPISSKDILFTKLLLHLAICIPVGIIFSLSTIIVFHISLIDALFVISAPILFTMFIALLGLLMNLWKPKFDWINETACVKQSMPVMITMFTAMGVAFVIGGIYIPMSQWLSIDVYMYMVFVVFIVLDIILYYQLNTWGIEKFEKISA